MSGSQAMRNGSVRAVLMAGGRSERMRASLGPLHKVLVDVTGVPLLERNVCYLLAAGFRDIVVLVSAGEHQVIDFVQSRCAALAAARNARLDCVLEDVPRGTIGGLALLPPSTGSSLVMAADNLTSLDLSKLIDRHLASAAPMTIATHEWSVQVPFGELALAHDFVHSYAEKPIHRVPVSSALYVVEPEVVAGIDPGSRCDTPDLVKRLLDKGSRVAAFPHDSFWVDVNDAVSHAQAEALVKRRQGEFEQWWDEPDEIRYCLAALAAGDGAVQADRRMAAQYSGSWSVPMVSSAESLHSLHAEFPCATELRATAAFDDLDVRSGQVVRYRAYTCEVDDLPRDHSGFDWMPLSSEALRTEAAGPMKRLMAYLPRVVNGKDAMWAE